MPEPVLLDEWQEVPELMGAVRRAVDEDSRPGRFLLTGSARARRGAEAWSGIGRVVNLRMYGLTVRETLGRSGGPTFLDRLAAAGISRMTAGAYERLLSDLFVFEALPAWSNNRLSRLVKGAKRYLVDTSLVAAALRLDERAVLRDGDLLGRLIDTFAVSQLRPEAELGPWRARLHHLREKDGRHEIDPLAEVAGGDVIALEIKATAAPGSSDARHLTWLRDQLGPRFLAGAVLHTGPRPFALGERLLALPICSLWN